jgi:hypothetical protein
MEQNNIYKNDSNKSKEIFKEDKSKKIDSSQKNLISIDGKIQILINNIEFLGGGR